jgi:hypothetical protein
MDRRGSGYATKAKIYSEFEDKLKNAIEMLSSTQGNLIIKTDSMGKRGWYTYLDKRRPLSQRQSDSCISRAIVTLIPPVGPCSTRNI